MKYTRKDYVIMNFMGKILVRTPDGNEEFFSDWCIASEWVRLDIEIRNKKED